MTRKPRLQLVTDDTGDFATGREQPASPGPAVDRESFIEARTPQPPESPPEAEAAQTASAEALSPPAAESHMRSAAYAGTRRFSRREEGVLRSLATIVAINALAFAAVSGVLLYRAWTERLPLLAALGAVAALFALSHVRAASAFRRVIITADRDAAHMARGLGLLRGVFVWKGITLFLLLALACFSLSILVSFLALL